MTSLWFQRKCYKNWTNWKLKLRLACVSIRMGNAPKDFQKPLWNTPHRIQTATSCTRGVVTAGVSGGSQRYHQQNVVPHNAHLCLTFNAHINVEAVAPAEEGRIHSSTIKYLFKYMFKGSDRTVPGMTIDNAAHDDPLKGSSSFRA